MKFQNGTQIKDGRQNVLLLKPCIFDFSTKLLLLKKIIFLKNSKWLGNFYGRFFAQFVKTSVKKKFRSE
jgi:hypothetical protein